MPASVTGGWTAGQVRAMQDEAHAWPRYELVDGLLLVTNAPRPVHQLVVSLLMEQLLPYVRRHDLGRVLTSPSALELEPNTVVQPDLFVVRAADRPVTQWSQVAGLLLAVEVLSPSTANVDRTRKRRLYQRAGVADYWVVDADARLVERWTPTDLRPEPVEDRLTWRPAGGAEPLALDLSALFAEAWGDAADPAS